MTPSVQALCSIEGLVMLQNGKDEDSDNILDLKEQTSHRQSDQWLGSQFTPCELPGGAMTLVQLHCMLCSFAQQIPQHILIQISVERHTCK